MVHQGDRNRYRMSCLGLSVGGGGGGRPKRLEDLDQDIRSQGWYGSTTYVCTLHSRCPECLIEWYRLMERPFPSTWSSAPPEL